MSGFRGAYDDCLDNVEQQHEASMTSIQPCDGINRNGPALEIRIRPTTRPERWPMKDILGRNKEISTNRITGYAFVGTLIIPHKDLV